MENAGINYTGSTRQSLELERNKYQAKKALEIYGISTAPYFRGIPGRHQEENQFPLNFPLFVKPVCESDSQGIAPDSVVNNFYDSQKKVTSINTRFQQPALVEKLIVGREFTDADGCPYFMEANFIWLSLVMYRLIAASIVLVEIQKINKSLV